MPAWPATWRYSRCGRAVASAPTMPSRIRLQARRGHRRRPAQRGPSLCLAYRTIVTIGCEDSSRYRASSCSRDVALTVQVRERYFPSLDARISIEALSKSGACRSTTARMACANPSSVRPTIFIGNAQGNSRSVSVISIGPIWGRSAGRASLDAGTPIHVFARRRVRQLAIGKRPTGEELKYRQPAALKRVCRSGEVDAPHAELLLADFAPRRIGVALQPIDPVPQGARIVF